MTTETETTAAFALTDNTTGQTWDYPTEAKLRTCTRLYAVQHPKSSLTVTINGQAHVIR
jgi:hypothetical protein